MEYINPLQFSLIPHEKAIPKGSKSIYRLTATVFSWDEAQKIADEIRKEGIPVRIEKDVIANFKSVVYGYFIWVKVSKMTKAMKNQA